VLSPQAERWLSRLDSGCGAFRLRSPVYCLEPEIEMKLLCPLWVKSGHLHCNRPCPLCPQKRTCAVQLWMSAKGQKRTSLHPVVSGALTHVTFFAVEFLQKCLSELRS
jgi:hypothetical protein